MSKIVGIAVASTALNGALSLWLVALRRRLRKRTKDAQENKRDKDAGVKRTNSDGAMVSMELLKSIAWQQYPSYTRPSALQEEKKYYSAVEEAAQLRALNKNLVAQVDQLEETLLTLSRRESSWKRVEELEEQLAQANEMLEVLEAECEMMESVVGKEGMTIFRDQSMEGSAKLEKILGANGDGNADDYLSPRTPNTSATRSRYD